MQMMKVKMEVVLYLVQSPQKVVVVEMVLTLVIVLKVSIMVDLVEVE